MRLLKKTAASHCNNVSEHGPLGVKSRYTLALHVVLLVT